jgi:hypothetical protein
MPRVEVIEVSDWLITHTPDLRIQLGGVEIPCQSGKQLASLYVGEDNSALTFDYLPRELLQSVRNLADFARVLVLDKWTCNADGRQAIFSRQTSRSRRYDATFVDQGYCFNAGEWTFPDSPLRGAYANNCVYEGVTGWDAFEPSSQSGRADGCSRHLAVRRRYSRRVVRGRPGRSGTGGGNSLQSPTWDPQIDRRILQINPGPISELERFASGLWRLQREVGPGSSHRLKEHSKIQSATTSNSCL